MTSCGKCAARTALAAVALAVGVPGILPSARPGPEAADEATRGDGREARPADPGHVELQRQLNELRSDLLDDREQRIGRQLEANGTVLVVLGIVIGVAGLWFYARFHVIATEARIGAAAARYYFLAPPGLLSDRLLFSSTQDLKANPARGKAPTAVSAEVPRRRHGCKSSATPSRSTSAAA